MSKLTRRLATTGIPLLIAGGALLGTVGPATAATARPAPPLSPEASVTAGRQPTAHRHIDPWIAGQLALFDPAAARRLAVYDPWVKDQLAQFAGHGAG